MATYNNFIEVFDNINAFAEAINTRKVNKTYEKYESSNNLSSQSVSSWWVDYSGTSDYKTANNLLLNGDGANLDKLTAVNIKTLPVSNDIKNTLVKSVCGGVPLVPLALIGVPKNMLATRKAPKVAKVVNIVYNSTFYDSYTTEQIITAGAKVASLVKALEARKVRVNLWAAVAVTRGSQYVCSLINVKKSGAPLNMLRIAYPLINPSWLRRSAIRWFETCPAALAKSGAYCGCGVNLQDDATIKEMITAKVGKDTILLDGMKLVDADINDKVNTIFAK